MPTVPYPPAVAHPQVAEDAATSPTSVNGDARVSADLVPVAQSAAPQESPDASSPADSLGAVVSV
jgi:hypothetical protein